MNIYKISQTVNNSYDTYDSAIVIAKTKEDARQISPDGWGGTFPTWAYMPRAVQVECVGKALKGSVTGIVLASYRAGYPRHYV